MKVLIAALVIAAVVVVGLQQYAQVRFHGVDEADRRHLADLALARLGR